VTSTDFATLTPSPVQVNVNVVEAVIAALVADPFTTCVPVQPPEAVQAVAFWDVQVRLTVAPEATAVALLWRVTAGPTATLIA